MWGQSLGSKARKQARNQAFDGLQIYCKLRSRSNSLSVECKSTFLKYDVIFIHADRKMLNEKITRKVWFLILCLFQKHVFQIKFIVFFIEKLRES